MRRAVAYFSRDVNRKRPFYRSVRVSSQSTRRIGK